MKPLIAIEEKEYVRANNCYLSRNAFLKEDYLRGHKVRDHYHITCSFLGGAHRQCNIERPVKQLIPVFFHYLRGYESHLIVHQFRFHKERAIKVISQNVKKYLQIQWCDNLLLFDSFSFLISSLDPLSGSLSKYGRENFKHTSQVITSR